ncbi:MAG: hypothetical protein JW712_04920 [Dehalococcoidales bacterium]|nr:hypothetical protein [Dehalococcoidales bacterium]
MRITVSAFGFGVIGSVICIVMQYIRIILVPTYPPLNTAIWLSISSASGFLGYGVAYLLYAKSAYRPDWFFGGAGGAVSGAATGIGYILSADLAPHSVIEFLGNGLIGAIIGGFMGMILGILALPWIAKVTRSQ